MKIHAFDEIYLDYARTALGEAADYACLSLNVPIDQFFAQFISSGVAKQFQDGNVKYICGMSGAELAMQITNTSAVAEERLSYFTFSPEYWTGFMLSYFQWETNIPYKVILSNVPASEILKMYNPHHEAADDKFVEVLKAKMEKTLAESRLKISRKRIGLTQAELAELSGVNLRTLQQYENKSKNINSAAVQTILNLCKVLHCEIQDIIEY